jgi:hypothetical protein
MEFGNYKPAYYDTPIFDRYLYNNRKKLYSAPVHSKSPSASTPSFSLDEILLQDSTKLLDQVVNTALNITYRLRVYRDISSSLETKWNELSAEIGELSGFKIGYNMSIERRRSMLEKERNTIEKQQLEHKLQAWEDLTNPIRYLIQDFHKHRELKNDQETLSD